MFKRLLVSLCIIFVPLAGNPHQRETLYINQDTPIQPYEKLWLAISKVESGGDPFAIGDKHLKNKSYGIVQIRQTRLDDYERETGIYYTIYDMFDPSRAKSVFLYYATKEDYRNIEKISRCWNGGKTGMRKQSTKKYYQKVLKAYLELE